MPRAQIDLVVEALPGIQIGLLHEERQAAGVEFSTDGGLGIDGSFAGVLRVIDEVGAEQRLHQRAVGEGDRNCRLRSDDHREVCVGVAGLVEHIRVHPQFLQQDRRLHVEGTGVQAIVFADVVDGLLRPRRGGHRDGPLRGDRQTRQQPG